MRQKAKQFSLPNGPCSMMQAGLTKRLTGHLKRRIEETDRARARLHLLDWLACVAGARLSRTATIARSHSAGPSLRAAWLANLLEMDDVHRAAILHPGPVVWAVCLAAHGNGGMDSLLDAAVRGYEAMIAIGSTFDARHYAFWHNTATAGAFGAAVAALCVEAPDASEDMLADALGLAGSVTGGLWQMRHEPCDAKQWHVANAARCGLDAARAARAGAGGPRFILEGPQGLHAATCAEPRPLHLKDGWLMHDVSFKPWGACRHAHPAIDAALGLKERLGTLEGEILVETYADALTFCDRPAPDSVIEAKFSIQHAVALVADKGEPALADFEPAAIAEAAASRTRVKLVESAEFTARYPAHFGARVQCGGESCERIDTLGDPERPLDVDGIIAKLRALIAWGGLPPAEADRAIAIALEGTDTASIPALLEDWLS